MGRGWELFDGVGMGATGPEPALLPSLGAIGAGFIIFVFQVLFKVMLFFKFQFKEWRNRDGGMAQTWGSNGDNIYHDLSTELGLCLLIIGCSILRFLAWIPNSKLLIFELFFLFSFPCFLCYKFFGHAIVEVLAGLGATTHSFSREKTELNQS